MKTAKTKCSVSINEGKNMKQKIDFFRDEIRNGFYVPTSIKQAWATELDVLKEIDKICKRYNIKYFADAGTLLGAVRHGGFIPWDDDIDIVMFREDFEFFLKKAKDELPEEYTIHDYKQKENYHNFSVKIVNGQRINFESDSLKNHYNFPWLSCVDVFPLDYLYEDSEKEKQRDNELLFMLVTIEEIESVDEIELTEKNSEKSDQKSYQKLSSKSLKLLDKLEKTYNITISREGSKRTIANRVRELFVEHSKRVTKEESNLVGILHPFIISGEEGIPKNYYEDVLFLPFEDIKISVPVGYDDILNRRYNDYKVCVKSNALHNYPFFEKQKEEMERLAGKEIFEFKINPDKLINRPIVDVCECERELTLNEHLNKDASLVENNDGNRRIKQAKREIVFLPIGIKEWKSMQPYYENAKKEDDTVVYIIPLPLMKKDFFGNIISSDEEIFESLNFDAYLREESIEVEDIKSFIDYKIEKSCPDEVYIQNPYDNENPLLTVPSNYYVEYMRKYAFEIKYLPIGTVDEFDSESIADNYNLKHYLCKPGAVYADKIIAQSENMKKIYIKKLVDTFGEEYTQIWKNKIQVTKYI